MITERDIAAKFPDLQGKVALVTGAGGGIGHGICLFLARQGMKIAASDYGEDKLASLRAVVEPTGAELMTYQGDLSTVQGAHGMADACVEAFGTPDVLVNSAGRLGSGHFLKTGPEVLEETTVKNIRLCYYISRVIAEKMAERGSGRIINLSSVGAERAHGWQALYDTSKGAIHALTKAMAIDLAASGIRVNAVVPGATISQHKHFFQTERAQRLREAKNGMIPLGRMGQPEDVAAMIAFLASDASDYVTGSIFHVDGGIFAQLSPPGTSI